ncbi:MAG TPA: DUF72 domain-containing protein [Myxococcales bacterium]|nr:DUF72 domain-containing protein [Myxococcales bacterium]
MTAGIVRFGPAGWDYPDWAGKVYPAPRPEGFDPLRYLADYFDAIEINSTFYRPATAKVSRGWVERVAGHPDFRFTAKLYQRFTHQRQEAWTSGEVDEVRSGLEPLASAGKLGALLLQFPWSFRNTEENREWLRDLAKAFRGYPLVVEVRHLSWNEPDFYAELSSARMGIVNLDQPMFHNSLPPSARATSPLGYIRVHGRNYKDWFRKAAGRDERYDYLYTADELKPWAERTRALADDPSVTEVYVVNNNHFAGQAVTNALMLRAQVTGARVKVPPTLLAAFPKDLTPIAR